LKQKTLISLEKDVGLRTWQLVELNKFLDESRKEKSFSNAQDLSMLLSGNIGELMRYFAYKKYNANCHIDMQVMLSDMIFILMNIIRTMNYNLEDILRLGLVRYKEKIWITKKQVKK